METVQSIQARNRAQVTPATDYEWLAKLPLGASGVIEEIKPQELQVHLMSLGLAPGDTFTLTDKAPFGGPLALKVHGTKIAIRKNDAAGIKVRVIG